MVESTDRMLGQCEGRADSVKKRTEEGMKKVELK